MLYVAFVTLREELRGSDLAEKCTKWWNEGARPPGLTFRSTFGTIGPSPTVLLLETDDPSDLQGFVSFWCEFEIDIHPAVDPAETYCAQGMNVPNAQSGSTVC